MVIKLNLIHEYKMMFLLCCINIMFVMHNEIDK